MISYSTWDNCDFTNENLGMVECSGSGGRYYEFRRRSSVEQLIILGDVKDINVLNAPELRDVIPHDVNIPCMSIVGSVHELTVHNPG